MPNADNPTYLSIKTLSNNETKKYDNEPGSNGRENFNAILICDQFILRTILLNAIFINSIPNVIEIIISEISIPIALNLNFTTKRSVKQNAILPLTIFKIVKNKGFSCNLYRAHGNTANRLKKLVIIPTATYGKKSILLPKCFNKYGPAIKVMIKPKILIIDTKEYKLPNSSFLW